MGLSGFPNARTLSMTRSYVDAGLIGQPRLEEKRPCIAGLRPEESIETLRNTADILQGGIDKAQGLRDDLAFLIDRGDQAADSLEDLVRHARDMSGVKPKPGAGASADAKSSSDKSINASDQSAAAPDETGSGGTKSQAEQELLRAIRSAG